MDLLEAIACVLERRGAPADRVRRVVDAIARASARGRIEQILFDEEPAARALLAACDGWARVEGQEFVFEGEVGTWKFEKRFPMAGQTPLVSGRVRVEAGARLTEGDVAPGDLLRILGPGAAGDAIKAALRPLVALSDEDLDQLVEPMFSLLAVVPFEDAHADLQPPTSAPRLSREAFGAATEAIRPGDPLPFVGYEVLAGYDLLATHSDLPLDRLRLGADAEPSVPPRADTEQAPDVPVATDPDGSFVIRTEGCREHGHREVALRWSRTKALAPQVASISRYLATTVKSGTRYEPGQTLLVGGRLTRFALDGQDLTLEELDYTASPPTWKPGVDQTMSELALQRHVAESYGLLEAIDFARGDQWMLMCSDAQSPGPFLLARRTPTTAGDSGWSLGCGDTEHDHDAEGAVANIRVHDVIRQRPSLARFLALPPKSSVFLRSFDFHVLYDGAIRDPESGSYMALVQDRANRGDFELDSDIVALISEGRHRDAVDLTRERYLCAGATALDRIDPIKKRFEDAQRSALEAHRASVDRGALVDEITTLLRGGRKLAAVVRCKEALQMGLAEAKEYVDAIEARLGEGSRS